MISRFKTPAVVSLVRVIVLLGMLYLFLSAITLMGGSFKLLGKGVAETLIQTTSNPFVGLLIGLLVTSIVQSSSVTTSMVVALVSGGALSIEGAVPIVMGANMGTTITCAIVSVGHITRNDEFERAYAGATVHDFFNLLSVIILLPLELMTHWMEKFAGMLSSFFYGVEASTFNSPIKVIVKPFAHLIEHFLSDTLGLSHKATGVFGLIISVLFIFLALTYMVKLMRLVFAERVEGAMHKIFGANVYLTLLIGVTVTALIQSSSITTSILVPLLGAGVITLEHAFPMTLGANIGTTITAILAALAGNQAGLTIAFVHLTFNLAGTAIFLPIPFMRKIPIFLARKLAAFTVRNKKFAFIFIGVVFFVIPGLGVILTKIW
jgi:sodium-dependent phosphate cotransporter